MLRRIAPAPSYRRSTLLLATLVAAACSDGTGPDGGGLPGRRLLDAREFSQWTWTPNGAEIVFSTPFDPPYTGPLTRLEAVTVPGGSRRTVVAAPSNGDRIVGYRFSVVGSHIYYEVANPSYDVISFYRARLDGSSPPEKVVDVASYGVSVSPDERTVAWVGFDQAVRSYLLVTTDIASGARRTYTLDYTADRITWSPTGRTIVIEPNGGSTAGAPLQWVDLASGAVRVWSEPSPAGIDILPSRHIGWNGESPTVYVAGVDVARYSMATGSRELLSTLTAPGRAIGWSPDFETVTIETTTCRAWAGGNCSRWTNSVDRVAWRSTVRTSVLRFDGTAPMFGRAAPAGPWVGYEYNRGGGSYGAGDGVYVQRMP